MFAVTPQVLLQLRCEGLPHGGCEEPVGGARRWCSEGWVQPGGARRHDPHSHLHRRRPQRLQRRRAQERPRGAPRTPSRLPRTLPPVPLEREWERPGQLTSNEGALLPIRAQLYSEPSADWTSGNHRLQNQPFTFLSTLTHVRAGQTMYIEDPVFVDVLLPSPPTPKESASIAWTM